MIEFIVMVKERTTIVYMVISCIINDKVPLPIESDERRINIWTIK